MRLSNKEIQKIQKQVLATMKVENAIPSPEAREINKQFLEGNINSKTAIEKIKSLYDIKTKVKKERCCR